MPPTEAKCERERVADIRVKFPVADEAFGPKLVWVFVLIRIVHACPVIKWS